MLRLKVIEGRTYNADLQPERVILKTSATRFGRSSEHSDVVLDSSISPRMISRMHAVIYFEDGKFKLDCKGMNGVVINKTKKNSAILHDGDELVFGGAGVKTEDGQHVPSPESELVYILSEITEGEVEEERSLGEGTSDGRVRRSKRKVSSGNECSAPTGKKSKVANDKSKETVDHVTDRVADEAHPLEEKEQKVQTESNVPELKQEDSNQTTKSKKWLEDLNEELLCCICRELMVLAHTLPCSHAFCYSCIKDWLGQASDCPNCRASARLKSAVPVKALDNTIDRVAEEVLSAEELAERKQKIQEIVAEKTKAKETAHTSASSESNSDSSSEADDSTDSEESYYDPSYSYSVEHARSGRAQCRSCSSLIANRSLRWSVQFETREYRYYTQTHYHHLRCFQLPSSVTVDMVRLDSGLTAAEKRQVRARIRGR